MYINRGTYIELAADQRTPEWFQARKLRCTASKTSIFVTGESKFSTLDDEIQYLIGSKLPQHVNLAMQFGTMGESLAVESYEKKTGQKIKEISLCFPVWTSDLHKNVEYINRIHGNQLDNPLHPHWFLGGSPDGITYDEDIAEWVNIEIKYPRDVYFNLLNKRAFNVGLRISSGKNKKRQGADKYPHIFISHYMQMQQCMAITGNKFCDYVVDSSKKNTYIERIEFDEKYWWEFMYPELIELIEIYLKPKILNRDLQKFKENNMKLIASVKSKISENVVVV